MRRSAPAAGMLAAAVLTAAAATAQTSANSLTCIPARDVPREYSEPARLACRSLLLDATRAGRRLVVVGERGHILTSDDEGTTWKQAPVPTRANLTGVYFADEKHGWAVGHDEVILRSQDGGDTWRLVYSAPENEQPLLAVWFRDTSTGLAIGAYGRMLASTDGGETWVQVTFDPKEAAPASKPAAGQGEDEDVYLEEMSASDAHLNAIERADDGRLYIAAEAGHVFRSDDDGATWLELPSPYEGSFFGVLPLAGDSLLVFGLRGHLFRSDDAGLTWTEIPTNTVAMLTDGVREGDSIAIGGLAGTLLLSSDGGQSFTLHQEADRRGIATLVRLGESRYLAAGEGGIKIIDARAVAPSREAP